MNKKLKIFLVVLVVYLVVVTLIYMIDVFTGGGSLTELVPNPVLSYFVFVIASIVFVFPWTLLIIIPCAIYKMLTAKSRKEQEINNEVSKQVSDYKTAMDTSHENLDYMHKKIVRCEYCRRQSRYGNGTCSHCGATLPTPDMRVTSN